MRNTIGLSFYGGFFEMKRKASVSLKCLIADLYESSDHGAFKVLAAPDGCASVARGRGLVWL